MSRLTYVSESDSTLKNTSVMCDPETHWVRKSMTVIMPYALPYELLHGQNHFNG